MCVTGHHVTTKEDRDGGQGQECHCLVCLRDKVLRDEEGGDSHLGNDAL